MCGPNGDDELRTSVYPSNLAPIGAKLRQHAFRTICNFRFFDAEKKKSKKNRFRQSVFHRFRQIFEELDDFWHQNLIRWGILRFGWSNFQVCTTLGAHFLIRRPLPNTPAHLVKREYYQEFKGAVLYYVITYRGALRAPRYRYMKKYIQQKQQQKQQLKQQQHLCLNKKHLLTLNKNIFKR